MAEVKERYAVVTGSNKGIGFEIVRQLAVAGVKVVLTARDEKRGLEAVQRLKDSGLSEFVVFHRLDVTDAASVASLADFIKSQFGKLDILVNNAGVLGVKTDDDALTALANSNGGVIPPGGFTKAIIETYESAEEGLQINYYGSKRTAQLLLPLLSLSDSPRIVNVSSTYGKLEYLTNAWARGVLSDADNRTEERVDEVLTQFLKDFKDDALESKGWPKQLAAYVVSKAAVNAYTRILAKKHPSFYINSVCPGYVKTDINVNSGILTVEEGASSPVRLALLPNGSPTGLFYIQKEISPF